MFYSEKFSAEADTKLPNDAKANEESADLFYSGKHFHNSFVRGWPNSPLLL